MGAEGGRGYEVSQRSETASCYFDSVGYRIPFSYDLESNFVVAATPPPPPPPPQQQQQHRHVAATNAKN